MSVLGDSASFLLRTASLNTAVITRYAHPICLSSWYGIT